jgi:hypothetical protein
MHVVLVEEMDIVMILCFLYISYFDNGYLQTDPKGATPKKDSEEDSKNTPTPFPIRNVNHHAMKSSLKPRYQFSYFVLSRSSSE